jgi:hypothetical protein
MTESKTYVCLFPSCPEEHPIATEEDEKITCPWCRREAGLPELEGEERRKNDDIVAAVAKDDKCEFCKEGPVDGGLFIIRLRVDGPEKIEGEAAVCQPCRLRMLERITKLKLKGWQGS